tara:strand:+ start:163 stop:1194 length:1032 start_codon:yes stop_codon:yes gene_type:complete
MDKIDIFAPNVRHGGGAILLKQLVESLIKQNLIGVVYVSSDLASFLPEHKNITFNKNSIFSRIYAEINLHKNYRQGSKILFFGNLPPIKTVKAHSILYLHNILLIKNDTKYNLPLKTKLRLFIESMYLKIFIKNVDEIFVQTPQMMRQLKVFKKGLKAEVRPFMDQVSFNSDKSLKNYDFIYPSYGYAYKNHILLLEAWIELSKSDLYPKMCLLLDKKLDEKLALNINQARHKYNLAIDIFYNIENNKVRDLYKVSSALIWPSFTESFGMPIIEAINLGLDIVAADLEYITDIVENAYLFNPNDHNDLKNTIINFLNKSEFPNNLEAKLKLAIPESNDFIKSI